MRSDGERKCVCCEPFCELCLMVDATVEEQLRSETYAGVRIKDHPRLHLPQQCRHCLAQHSTAPQCPSASPGMQ